MICNYIHRCRDFDYARISAECTYNLMLTLTATHKKAYKIIINMTSVNQLNQKKYENQTYVLYCTYDIMNWFDIPCIETLISSCVSGYIKHKSRKMPELVGYSIRILDIRYIVDVVSTTFLLDIYKDFKYIGCNY